MQTFLIEKGEACVGQRIDLFFVERLDKTRSAVQKMLAQGNLLVNGKIVDKNYKIKANDHLTAEEPDPIELDVQPENLPLPIVYEDEDLLVVNKPKGMVVHPALGNESGTMVNALLYHCKGSLSGINGVIRPGIVHRIDKDTSGLLIVAKTDRAHVGLAEQIQVHSFSRIYHAVVCGNIKLEGGTVNAPIGRHPNDRKRMAVVADGREAVTHYRVLERFGDFTYVECRLETGRTHQIRVHMASIGHPVAGDPVYGPRKVMTFLKGQCLHAKSIGFIHPITGKRLSFDSDLPEVFLNFLVKLQQSDRKGDAQVDFSEILLAVDCDGTLLREDKSISQRDKDAIAYFRSCGGKFTLVTGRSLPTVSSYIKELEVTMPVVLYNGAMVYDPVIDEALWTIYLPEESKRAMKAVLLKFGDRVGMEVLGEDGNLYAVCYNELVHEHLTVRSVPHVRCEVDEIGEMRWIKALFAMPAEEIGAVMEFLDTLQISGVRFVRSADILYEMLPEQANKGAALIKIGNLLNIRMEKTAAMGDYYNDLEMLAAVKLSIAPLNACDAVKKMVDLVVPSNMDDAVSKAIAYIMESKEEIFG